jgi:hypothetical protein
MSLEKLRLESEPFTETMLEVMYLHSTLIHFHDMAFTAGGPQGAFYELLRNEHQR